MGHSLVYVSSGNEQHVFHLQGHLKHRRRQYSSLCHQNLRSVAHSPPWGHKPSRTSTLRIETLFSLSSARHALMLQWAVHEYSVHDIQMFRVRKVGMFPAWHRGIHTYRMDVSTSSHGSNITPGGAPGVVVLAFRLTICRFAWLSQ